MSYSENNLHPQTSEEELAQRIKREVHRVGSSDSGRGEGEAVSEGETPEGETPKGKTSNGEIPKKKNFGGLFQQIFSGTILVQEGVSQYYSYMMCVALTFMVSIAVLFMTLHLDSRYTRLEREVKVLRERSIRMQEKRFHETTHTQITSELRRRGIELYDPHAPGEVIND